MSTRCREHARQLSDIMATVWSPRAGGGRVRSDASDHVYITSGPLARVRIPRASMQLTRVRRARVMIHQGGGHCCPHAAVSTPDSFPISRQPCVHHVGRWVRPFRRERPCLHYGGSSGALRTVRGGGWLAVTRTHRDNANAFICLVWTYARASYIQLAHLTYNCHGDCRARRHMTLWPSGQGVGLLSRWGLPAWVRIPQVSMQLPRVLRGRAMVHHGESSVVHTLP